MNVIKENTPLNQVEFNKISHEIQVIDDLKNIFSNLQELTPI